MPGCQSRRLKTEGTKSGDQHTVPILLQNSNITLQLGFKQGVPCVGLMASCSCPYFLVFLVMKVVKHSQDTRHTAAHITTTATPRQEPLGFGVP